MLMRRFAIQSVALSLVAASLSAAQQPRAASAPVSHRQHRSEPQASVLSPSATLTEREQALHLLNRLTFGPRPGDVDKVLRMGTDAWLEGQLNPGNISDAALDSRLADYPGLKLTPAQMLTVFPTQILIREIAQGKKPYPADPMLAGVYQVLVYQVDQQTKLQQQQQQKDPAAPEPTDAQKAAQKKADQQRALGLADQLLGLPKNQRMAEFMKAPVEDRAHFVSNVQEPQKSMLLADFAPREREMFYEMAAGPNANSVIPSEVQQAKILRAVLSERQLQEVMTDFWFNHFNVYIYKDSDAYYTSGYERDAIRAHALGKFRDLLLATAEHPAMLVYLDNWLSIGPNSPAAGKPKPGQKNVAQRGLNENYGREVMELHTVGVDGGYSQADVTNLSKILTGWTVDHPEQGGGFLFDPRRHEPGSKPWFGQNVEDNGFAEGEHALEWLAAQPQTAHFVCYKLAQRFVADDPPASLVDSMAETFASSDGDISQVLRAMIHSREFWQPRYYRVKVKTPLEFVASALRATETSPSNPNVLVGTLGRMGQPLYQMQPPTGYPMTASHWMSSGALVDRLNFSLALANSKLGNIKFDAPHLLAASLLARPPAHPNGSLARNISVAAPTASPSGADEALGLMADTLIGGQVSAKTNAVIRQQLNDAQQHGQDPSQVLDTMTALILGSPEFQMR